jgi:hypothetical protein
MTPRDRRALSWGAGLALGAVLVLRVLPWVIRTVRAEHGVLLAQRALLLDTQSIVAAAPLMEDSVRHLTHRIATLAPLLLQGQAGAEAEADLATRVSLSAERQHLTVERVVPLPDTVMRAGGTLRRVTVQASLIGDTRELLALIDTLRRDPAVLTPASLRLATTNPDTPGGAPEAIHADLSVTGWYLIEEKAK